MSKTAKNTSSNAATTDNTTLDCRMLCACGVSYAIGSGNPLSSQTPYYEAVGFTSTPQVFQGIVDVTAGALVGTTGDGIVVAFRGTVFTSVVDWLTDFLVLPIATEFLPGKVHAGMFGSLLEIIGNVAESVHALVERTGLPVIVTGHSKGGGMASLAALWLEKEWGIHVSKVRTFASPKVGDAEFADAYNAHIEQISYENDFDIVPFLAPSEDFALLMSEVPVIGKLFQEFAYWDYEPVGTDMYINADHVVEADGPLIMAERIEQLVAAALEGDIEKIGAAHAWGCGSGYMSGVCQGSVCGSNAALADSK